MFVRTAIPDSPATAPTPVRHFLDEQKDLEVLRFITCGSVDDGKSTLIGRLLWESSQVFDDQLAGLARDSKKYGTQGDDVDLALLVDGLTAEREQGITIDVAYRYFATPRRRFVVADTPGHEQYTRNMFTGATTASLAVILVDAQQGVLTQTRRHAFLASLAGIRHIVLAVNKLDLLDYDEQTFSRIVTAFDDFARTMCFESIMPIPLSALTGCNVTTTGDATPWYDGPSLLTYLEMITVPPGTDGPLVFPVQWINRPSAEFRGFSGSVAQGRVAVGERLRVTSSGECASVKRIVTYDGDLTRATTEQAVTLTLDREIDCSRGDVLSAAGQPLEQSDQVEATLVWLDQTPGYAGRRYDLMLLSQSAGASITAIKHRVDVNTMAEQACQSLELNDIAVCNLAMTKPIALAPYRESRSLGAFILIDRLSCATVAAGMIQHSLRRASNVHRQALSITKQQREQLNSHRGHVVWFTGLSGAGKSVLASELEVRLNAQGVRTYVLDGDNLRHGLNRDLGFTETDRIENVRRVIEVAALMQDAALVVLVSLISPFARERKMARERIGEDSFTEVYVSTALAVCEKRDTKGLYKKARAGELPNLTGIGSPYEVPECAEHVIDTESVSVDQAVEEILDSLSGRISSSQGFPTRNQ